MRRAAVSAARQRGVALAVVVWFVAGMSLLVAGIVLSARTDVRLAQIHLGRAQAAAAGDGAVNLLLGDITDARGEQRSETLAQRRYLLGEHWVAVAAVPAEWLVDPNTADASLLAEIFELAGAASSDGARDLAERTVQWRRGRERGTTRRLRSMEDLLRVEGMNRASWDAIRDYVVIIPGQSGIGVGGSRLRTGFQRLREASPGRRILLGDSLVAGGEGAGRSAAGTYRVDAIVEIGERRWLRRRWVSLRGGRGVLPWRVLRTEPARLIARGAG